MSTKVGARRARRVPQYLAVGEAAAFLGVSQRGRIERALRASRPHLADGLKGLTP